MSGQRYVNQPTPEVGLEKVNKLWRSRFVQSNAQNSNILCSRVYVVFTPNLRHLDKSEFVLQFCPYRDILSLCLKEI